MKKRLLTLGLAALMAVSGVPFTGYAQTVSTVTAEAESAAKTVSYLEIMDTNNLDSVVTRGQFAQMLVNASSYKGKIEWTTLTSPFADVKSSHWAAPYIQIAANNGWMYGYLGGKFKPEEPITLQEAVYGVTGLLGYAKSDFTGSQLSGRMSLYFEKELNKNITKTAGQTIVKRDAMNLFYNMLKTNTKNGTVSYGAAVFECTIDSATGEINYLALADDKLVGPILLQGSLSSDLPFSTSEGQYYKDGTSCKSVEITKGTVIYYNEAMKTVWAYTDCTESYEVTSSTKVYYANGGIMPTSVVFDSEKTEYTFKDSAVAYEFSAMGSAIKDDQTITIIYEDQSTSLQEIYVITGVVVGK